MTRFALETALHWTGVGCYIAATVALVYAVVFGKARWLTIGLAAAALGLLPHGVAILVRWVAVGHGPYMLKYEVLSSNAWVAVAILLVAAGLFSNPETRDLPPTLRSIWLAFHITFAKIAAASFLISVASSVLLLLRLRPSPPRWLRSVPEPAALDALTLRSTGFGLIFWTVAIAAGAIWGNQSWGRYWGWDPIETWSLASWLAYGSFLHVRFFFKLGQRGTALFSLACFGVFALVLFILPFVVGSLHAAYFS